MIGGGGVLAREGGLTSLIQRLDTLGFVTIGTDDNRRWNRRRYLQLSSRGDSIGTFWGPFCVPSAWRSGVWPLGIPPVHGDKNMPEHVLEFEYAYRV